MKMDKKKRNPHKMLKPKMMSNNPALKDRRRKSIMLELIIWLRHRKFR